MCIFIRLFVNLITGILLSGCISYSAYPREWPEIVSGTYSSCNNISGDYKDKYYDINDKKEYSLSYLLIYSENPIKDVNKEKSVINAATHVTIVHTDRTIELKIMKEQETLMARTLVSESDASCLNITKHSSGLFKKRIICSEGLHVRDSALEGGEGVIGSVGTDLNLLTAADGSLIVRSTSAVCGCNAVPFLFVENHYFRFEKNNTK